MELPGSVWVLDDHGRTIFARCKAPAPLCLSSRFCGCTSSELGVCADHKNVLGLPFIMAGDFFFDDAAMTVRVGERGAG